MYSHPGHFCEINYSTVFRSLQPLLSSTPSRWLRRAGRGSEIWTAYQREGDSSVEPKKWGFQKGTHLLLAAEEQAEIREAIMTRHPEEFGIPGSLWTLKNEGRLHPDPRHLYHCRHRDGRRCAADIDRLDPGACAGLELPEAGAGCSRDRYFCF